MRGKILLGVVALALALHLAVFAQAVGYRLQSGVWDSDFAIFYRAAYLMGHGAMDQVLRYHPPGDPGLVAGWPGLERGYWYARLPFFTVLTAPLGFLPITVAFILWSVVLLLANLSTALLLWKAAPGLRWLRVAMVAVVLAMPLPVFLATRGQALEVWRWGWPAFTWPQFPSGIHWGIYAWGQDAPLLLLAITGALVAARRRPGLAGLLFALGLAKPLTVLALPLLLWTGRHRLGALVASLALWGFVLNFPFIFLPGLSPFAFYAAAKGYAPIALENLLQFHNYLWLYGAPLIALYLWLGGRKRKEMS